PARTARRAAASNGICSMRCACKDRTRPCCAVPLEAFIPGRREAATSGRAEISELHRRGGFDFGASGAEIEEILAGEAEHTGEQRRRHLLDAGVVFLNRVVVEAAARGDLVLEVGQFARQLLEVG